MGILRVSLFGGIHVTHSNWLREDKLTREIQALLAYLLLQRNRTQPRDVLAGVFWGEHSHEKARRALNTALWRLKKALEPDGIPAGTYLIGTQSGEVGFNCESQYWLDAEVFERGTNRIINYASQEREEPDVQELEKIMELYKGELLEGFYDEWALRERERLRALYLKNLMYLMQYYKFQREYEKAKACGQQILDLDPIREDIHREMMRLYLESGQRPLAARQYAICQLTLAKELGISPMEETQTLYAEIFPEAHKSHLPLVSEKQPSFEQTLGQIRQLSQTIDLAREQVQQILQLITKPTKPRIRNSVPGRLRPSKPRNRKSHSTSKGF